MNEISNANFNVAYSKLENSIHHASFIAIDTEFTGICSEEILKPSLFDSLDNRYNDLKRNIEPFSIVQFGIATFQYQNKNNCYLTKCFNFYLFPKPIPFKKRQLSWEASTMEFLSKHNFDFNKLVNDGIPYLNEGDKQLLCCQLKQQNLKDNTDHLTYDEEDDFKDCKSKISRWLNNDDNSFLFHLETSNPALQYMIQKELRSNFQNIWTTCTYNSIDVIKVTSDIRKILEAEEGNRLEEQLLDSYIGFSKVFRLLSLSKKPIVGHNVLLDLMFMHQQFYKPLPDEYQTFKKNIHTLFPKIYDTKFLSIEMRKLFDKEQVQWKVNSLSTLYEYFTSKEGRNLTFNSPMIRFDKMSDDKNYHNAGWDAYFAGYIFVKMAHVFCVRKFGTGLEERTPTHSEVMSSVKDMENSINITRGNEVCMNLKGADPLIARPQWLHVKLKSPYVDTKQLVEKLSPFGTVDVMPVARRRVLVAVINHKSAQHILQHFRSNQDFQVAQYNRLKHATATTICLWCGFVLTGGMFAWMLRKIFPKPLHIE